MQLINYETLYCSSGSPARVRLAKNVHDYGGGGEPGLSSRWEYLGHQFSLACGSCD